MLVIRSPVIKFILLNSERDPLGMVRRSVTGPALVTLAVITFFAFSVIDAGGQTTHSIWYYALLTFLTVWLVFFPVSYMNGEVQLLNEKIIASVEKGKIPLGCIFFGIEKVPDACRCAYVSFLYIIITIGLGLLASIMHFQIGIYLVFTTVISFLLLSVLLILQLIVGFASKGEVIHLRRV